LSPDVLLAFSLFAFVTSVTPGPNNIMMLASGVNFGFRRSIPHILGISLGFMVMVIAVGLGLNEIFTRYPLSYTVMRWVGAIYLVYLAWAIANSQPPEDKTDAERAASRPMGFLAAAAFQWVNPKAWIMAVSAFSTYVPAANNLMLIVGTAAMFAVINAPCVGLWAAFGSKMRVLLKTPRFRRLFNIAMAVLLLASMLPMLFATPS
jgi:threonine/homoserine/homoserine lactone efflux protein